MFFEYVQQFVYYNFRRCDIYRKHLQIKYVYNISISVKLPYEGYNEFVDEIANRQ